MSEPMTVQEALTRLRQYQDRPAPTWSTASYGSSAAESTLAEIGRTLAAEVDRLRAPRAARDAELLRKAAEAADCLTREGSPNTTTTLESAWYDGADAAVQLLHRMADEAGKVTPTGGEITQPDSGPLTIYRARYFSRNRHATLGHYRTREQAQARCIAALQAERPTLVPDVIFSWVGVDGTEVLGVSTPAEPRPDVTDYVVTEIAVEGDKPAQPVELTIYRASHDSIVMGLYTTAAAARAHCEAEERRSWPQNTGLTFDWIEDEEDGVAELTVLAGQNEESVTGYVVTALTVASEYDEEANG